MTRAELPSPQKKIQHRHKHQGNLNLHFCLCWPPVTVPSSSCCFKQDAGVWGTHWQAVRHDGSGGHRKACGERLAPTLRGRGPLWILPWSYTHAKYDLSQDGFRKVRKHKNSRLVQKNHRLLNTTQIGFYHCIALLPSGPKHEYIS